MPARYVLVVLVDGQDQVIRHDPDVQALAELCTGRKRSKEMESAPGA